MDKWPQLSVQNKIDRMPKNASCKRWDTLVFFLRLDLIAGCSSANTLRIQRLEFGREQLTKGPNVIRYACRHRWCALPPAGLIAPWRVRSCSGNGFLPQTHVNGLAYPPRAWKRTTR